MQAVSHISLTFEWCKASINEMFVVEVSHKTTGTRGPEEQRRDAQLFGDIKGEAHDTIGYHSCHGGALCGRVVEL